MTAWDHRAKETAALLNPAFCGAVIIETIEDYGQPMPFALSFLVLPLVLHRHTRESMPPTVSTTMQVWLERNPGLKVGLAERVRTLVPYTREAVSFCLLNNALRLAEEASALEKLHLPRKRPLRPGPTAEVLQIFQKAALLGRWFALSTPATTFALLGIRP